MANIKYYDVIRSQGRSDPLDRRRLCEVCRT
jgi:hypothetical protein